MVIGAESWHRKTTRPASDPATDAHRPDGR